MNVRDYWISKLPEVRKQSSATGRLVESLLINDSKVARETLKEIAILETGTKLIEDATDRKKAEKEFKETVDDFNKNFDYKNFSDDKFKEKLNDIFDRLNKNMEDILSGKDDVSFFKKILNRLNELFVITGLKKVWDKCKPTIKYTSKLAAVVSVIYLSIIFGVIAKRKYKSYGAGILSFIVSVIVVGFFADVIFSLYEFFVDMYNMIVKLINFFRNKSTVQGEQQ